MTRCLAQTYGPTGRRRRCENEAGDETRNGLPVCDDHREPEKAGK